MFNKSFTLLFFLSFFPSYVLATSPTCEQLEEYINQIHRTQLGYIDEKSGFSLP